MYKGPTAAGTINRFRVMHDKGARPPGGLSDNGLVTFDKVQHVDGAMGYRAAWLP